MAGGKLPLASWKDYSIKSNDDESLLNSTMEDGELEDVPTDKFCRRSREYVSPSPSPTSVTDNQMNPARRSPPSCLRFSNTAKRWQQTSSSSSSPDTSDDARRKISFNEMAMVMWIDTVDELSDDEFDASYYSPQEYLAIREREKSLFRQLSNLGVVRSLSDDIMGLESRLQRYHRKSRSRESIATVIFEQEMNRNPTNGRCDDTILSQMYIPYSREASFAAQERAWKNSIQTGTTPIKLSQHKRYLSVCAPTNMMTEEKMEETFQEMKQAVETKVEQSLYSGVMKYAVACIPPSPATLRFGHNQLLEMAHLDEEENWSKDVSGEQDEDEVQFDEVDNSEEGKKFDLPLRQEMARAFFPPQITHCGHEYYHSPLNTHQMHQEVSRAEWLAQQERIRSSAFYVPPPPPKQQQRKQFYPPPYPPSPEWAWNPSLCDFVPVHPNRMVTWKVR